jgi:hypothetical protein
MVRGMWKWWSVEKAESAWQNGLGLSEEDALERLDALQNRRDRFWKDNYQELASFLLLSRYGLCAQSRQQRLLPLLERYVLLMASGCGSCEETRGGCEACCPYLDAAKQGLQELKKTAQVMTEREWHPEDLRRTEDVALLLHAIDDLACESHLDCEHLSYLPVSIRDALEDENAREDFCREVLANPSLKGHLIDLFRGYRECRT